MWTKERRGLPLKVLPSPSPRAGRRGSGDGKAVWQRLQPDYHLQI